MTPKDPEVQQIAQNKPVLLSVAFPYAPVGPHAVGGAEVICSQLEAALPALGFRSVVVAHADSRPEGVLYGTALPGGFITEEARALVEARHQRNIDRACLEHRVALVHMHGLDFASYRLPDDLPVLVTLHLPPHWYPESVWNLPPNFHLMCVSEHQRRACPAHLRDRIGVIPNGVPLPDRSTLRPAGRYALMMARICPEKNLHTALDAAKQADIPAVLAGDIFPYEAHQRYFSEQVQPRLTRATSSHERHGSQGQAELQARFVGPVSGAEKDRLLRRAACLLLPSLAPETSSLVAMEAMAAGIPVIAMAVGAVPEIVEDGRTGFLIAPGEGATERMADAIRRLPELDRPTCRAEAEERFPLARMVEAYAQRYRQYALQEQPEAASAPQGESALAPQALALDLELELELELELIQTPQTFHSITEEWTALWHADRNATPFQHPAWLLPWWHQFGPDGRLHSLAVRERRSQRLVALLPAYLYTEPASQERQLLFVGAGTTDYLDGLWLVPAAKAAASLCLSDLLAQRTTLWDTCGLSQLRHTSPLLAVAAAEWTTSPAEPSSALPLAGELPAKIRVNLNRYRRLAEARGAVTCALATTSAEALAWFDLLVQLHGKRWQLRGEEGVLADNRVLAHHRESLPLLLQAGLLRLFHLTLRGETMGVLYGLADGPQARERRLYLYLIGFDDRFAELSPGSLLLGEAWLHAKAHAFAKVDLLRGGEAYKTLWGAEPEPTLAISAPA